MKKYNIIYADPPWRFKNWSMAQKAKLGEKWGRAAGRPIYDCMTTEDIAALPVQNIADKNCALIMWATYPKLKECLETVDAWGFDFRTVLFTWVKTRQPSGKWHSGQGFYTRGNAEICLLGIKGRMPRVSAKVPNLLISPLGAHSAKPPETRDRIVRLFGDRPRIELFARPPVPSDWEATGNQFDGKDINDFLIQGHVG